jgi:hypothetical protein
MSDINARRAVAEKALADGNGILRLEPAYVARNFIPPDFRLGISEEEGTCGDRGWICERWLASETEAANPIPVKDEGLGFLALEGERMSLAEAVQLISDDILSASYAAKHGAGLHRLAKLFDYGDRLPYHLHQMQHDAQKVGENSKEEAYFFPEGVDVGKHPETFLGCHPEIVAEGRMEETFLPHLVAFNDDRILMHAPAFKQFPGDGFQVPAGMLHGPGTALTFELQENSDVYSMWQALVGGRTLPKETLYKDVPPDEVEKYGELACIRQVDWATTGDPDLYAHRHTPPLLIDENAAGREEWIFYNSDKFSGKRLLVYPGQTWTSQDAGVYSIFVWQGSGTVDGHAVAAGESGQDELLVSHARATEAIAVTNTGGEPLEIWKYFGKGVNLDVPMLAQVAR